MERDELRTTLVNHLETLRRNLQVVSMEVLKTKYKKPFDALRQDICKAATAYTRFLVFDGTYRITCENRTKLAQVLRYQFESKTLAV